MTWNEDDLKGFGANIQKLIEKQDLSRVESYRMFKQVLENGQPDLHQGAFLAALVSKGETPQEIAGAWQAIYELDTNTVSSDLGSPLVENSGTGMDRLKTFNVSSAGAIVAAAGGVTMARHGARALTSLCGTVDLLEAVGVDVECEVSMVEESIRQTGIGLFNGMSPKVHPNALGRILSMIRFGSTLNIAASLASPCRPTHALRGVYAEEMIDKAAEVMREIGYQHAMVVHGYDDRRENGMDELSTLGESVVREFTAQGKEDRYTLAPEDLGLKRVAFDDVRATGDIKQESERFLKVLAGKGPWALMEFTAINAGAVLHLAGQAQSLESGVSRALGIMEDGLALAKLAQWVQVQADSEGRGRQRFLNAAKTAGLEKEAGMVMD